MKRVVIVHCWSGIPNYCWYPQTKKELEEAGFEVEVPALPETDLPKLKLWLPKLMETIGQPDQDLYLIGHSAGVITILRYLESLTDDQKIGGAVFVAGFTDDLGEPELKNFFLEPINFVKIKQHCPKFVVICSDNDPYVDLKYSNNFQQQLGAKVIVKPNMGHFSGPVDNNNSCVSLPDVSQQILEISVS